MHIESLGNYSPRSNCNLIGVKCGFENKTQFPLQWEVIFEIQPTSTQLYFSKVHATFPPDGWTVFTSPFGGTYITKYMGLIDANTYLEFDIEPLMPLRYLIPEGPFPRVQVVTWDAAGNPFFTTPWEVPGSTMPGTTGIPFEGGTPSNPLAVSSLFFLPSASASCGLEYPWNIGISGVVAVDDDFCFLSPVNADPRPAWKMGKRTKIVVTAPNTLTLRGIDIESCGHCGIGLTCPEMWESIVVMPGATLICENVKFRDGIRAIDVKPGGKVALKNCTFRNNYIGVHLQGSAEVLALDDNTFIGGSLNEALEFPVGIEQEPDFPAQDKAFCGIYGLEATNLLLTPSNPGMRNTFKNIANGIVLERSNATIKNAFFENIQPLAGIHPFSGRGISARTNSSHFVEIMGQGASGPVNFDNVDVGIFTQRMYQLIHGNSMAQVRRGIELRDGSLQWVNITNNQIRATQKGIFAYNHGGFLKQISGNVVGMDDNELGVGIELADLVPAMSSFFSWAVFNNEVELDDARYGILVLGGGSTTLRNNEVHIITPNSSNRTGIRITGGQANAVRCNHVTGQALPTNFVDNTGIYTDNSPLSQVSCNTTALTSTGIQFWGDNYPSEVQANDYYFHGRGLLYGLHPSEGNAFTGPQDLMGNFWQFLYPGSGSGAGNYGAVHFGASPATVLASQYTFNSQPDARFEPTRYQPNAPMAPWFDPKSGQNASCPTVQSACNDWGAPWYDGSPFTEGDEHIAQGELHTDGHDDGLLYQAQRHLYRRWLRTNPASNAIVDSFALAVGATQMGQREQFLQDWHDVLFPSDSIVQALADLDETLQSHYEDLTSAESTLSTCEEDCASLQAQVNALRDSIALTLDAWQSITSSLQVNRAQQLSALESTLSTHTANTLMEQLENVVWGVWFDRMAGDSTHLTPLQQQTLEAVAATCPLDGGDPVFMARAMLAPYGLVQYDDFDACIEAEPRSADGSSLKETGDMHIRPNPARDQFILSWPDTDIAHICIIDMYGRSVHVQAVQEAAFMTMVDAGHLPVGIYQCVATDHAGRQIAISRLLISW